MASRSSLTSENISFARAACYEGALGYSGFLACSLFVGLVALLLYQWIDRRIQTQFTELVVQAVNEDWRGSGWRITADRVERVESLGVRFTGLALYAPDQSDAALRMQHVLIHASCELSDLVSKKVCPRVIEINDGVVDLNLQHATIEQWQQLFAFLESKRPPTQPRPRLAWQQTTIKINQLSATQPNLVLRDVSVAQIQPTSANVMETWQVGVAWNETAKLTSTWELQADATWRLVLGFQQFPIHQSMLAYLPARWRQPLESVEHLEGSVTGSVEINSPSPDRDWQYGGQLTVSQLWCQDRRVPHPLMGGEAKLKIQPDGWQLESLTGKLGESRVAMSGWQRGWRPGSACHWQGTISQFELRDEWVHWLPTMGQNIYRDLDPTGTVDVRFELTFDGNHWEKDLRADFTDLAFRYRKFPYRLQGCIGNARWVRDEINFSLQALENGQLVALDGQIQSPGPKATFQVNFRCDGRLPINDKLFQAIKTYPKVAEQMLSLRPQGNLGFQGRFVRTDAQLPPRLDYDVILKDCSVRHLKFEYPVRHIEGIIQVRDQRFTLKNTVGKHQRSQIVCEGGWSLEEGLDLRFLAEHVYLEQELKNALAPAWQQLWSQVRPQGSVRLARVDLRQTPRDPEPKINLKVTIRSPDESTVESPLEIHLAAFPYPLKELEGTVSVVDGQIEMQQLRAKHEQVWLSAQAAGQFSESAWQLRFFDVMVGGLKTDEHLLTALPTSLGQALRAIRVEGPVQLSGAFQLQGKMLNPIVPTPNKLPADIRQVTYDEEILNSLATADSNAIEISWEMRADFNRNQLFLGVPITEVFGGILFTGQFDGLQAVCGGRLELDSLMCLGLQFTQVSGPLLISPTGVWSGKFIPQANGGPGTESLQANVMGGTLKLDVQSWFDGQRKFYLQAEATDAEMPLLTRRFSPNTPPIKGLASLGLRLAGTTAQTEDLQGEGIIRIRETELYELPVILAILKFLAQPNKGNAAFDSSNVEFTLRGTQIRLNRIELIGDAISLLGNGSMNWDREIDLNFFTVAGRNHFYIPILSELFEVGSQQILWINVGGTADQPKATQKILPGLNDTLRQLLDPNGLQPDLSPGAGSMTPLPRR